jgi:alcohol dehydrogenase class IV
MRFEFATAERIMFGAGALAEVSPLVGGIGRRVFVVTGRSAERAERLLEDLRRDGLESTTFKVVSEPTTTVVEQAVAVAREAQSDCVISIGGGSVIDSGKAVGAMLANGGSLTDYLEVVGLGRPLRRRAVPHIAVPTTAGTGAEVTANSVLTVAEHRVKVSMRSSLMLPAVAVVDPLLTHSMPPAVTASTGLDALTQLAEAYLSNRANPLTDGICREGLGRAGRSLRRAYEDGSDAAAREDMALASLFGGLALANAKLGAVHGFAGPLGGMLGAPHGVICARLLPLVFAANLEALKSRDPESPALRRFDETARILTGSNSATAQDGIDWLSELCHYLRVPGLSQFGLKEEDFATVVDKARKSSSAKGNAIALSSEELTSILAAAV